MRVSYRRQHAKYFKNGRYPASALVTVSNFARSGCVIEIQSIAVI